jgi:hypothetical protein
MSFRDRLTHTLLVAHPNPATTADETGQLFVDETGQPIGDATSDPTTDEALWEDAVEVIGFVDERTSKWPEGPGAGPQLVDTRIYLLPSTSVRELDKLRRIDIDPPKTYQAVFVNPKYGRGLHHYEVQARRIPL